MSNHNIGGKLRDYHYTERNERKGWKLDNKKQLKNIAQEAKKHWEWRRLARHARYSRSEGPRRNLRVTGHQPLAVSKVGTTLLASLNI